MNECTSPADIARLADKNLRTTFTYLIGCMVVAFCLLWLIPRLSPDGLTAMSYIAAASLVYAMMQFAVSEYGHSSVSVTGIRVVFVGVSTITMIPIMQEFQSLWIVLAISFVASHFFKAPPASEGIVCRTKKVDDIHYCAHAVPAGSWFFHSWLTPWAQPRYYKRDVEFSSYVLRQSGYCVKVTLKADINARMPGYLDQSDLLAEWQRQIHAELLERLSDPKVMSEPKRLQGQDICQARVHVVSEEHTEK